MQAFAQALAAPVVAFVVSVLLVRAFLSGPARRVFLDHPNPRSLHAAPIPRAGGLGLMPAALLGMLIVGGVLPAVLVALALMLLSLVDDWKGLPAALRLPLHLAAAVGFVVLQLPGHQWFLTVVLAITIGWMTNLYNFMDGSDGLAGGMALIGFGVYAAGAVIGGDFDFALVNLAIAAAAAGFLVFNFPPARVFMGDAGSIPIGFLAGGLGLQGWQDGLWPLWFPVVTFGPFIVDASMTLARRAVHGEKLWQAHRTHYYQRLVLSGWSHRRTALWEYGLMLFSGATGLIALGRGELVQALAFSVLVLVYAGAMVAIDLRWRARARA